MTLALDDIELTGVDEYPVTESVKLWGPPGTGKTTQSAGRVAKLVEEHGYDVSDVAWATYRVALAEDTLNRFVDWGLLEKEQLDRPHEGATRNIWTTHAIANRCVGGLGDPVKEWHKGEFCSDMGIRYGSSKAWVDTPGELLFNVFEWMKENRLNPARHEDVVRCPLASELTSEWAGDVPTAWNRWEDYKAQREVVDFHEMLEAPLEERVVPTRNILVIDEYHDATPLLAAVCEFWMEHADIVIVAGDKHQVVNSYDGASPEFFERVDLPEVLLDKTYRVPEEHWQAATSLLSRAHDTPPVERVTNGFVTEWRSPEFEYVDSRWVVPEATAKGAPPYMVDRYGDDIMFLTRTRLQTLGVGYALEGAGVLYRSQKDMHGWVREKGAEKLALFNALQKIREYKPGHFGRGGGLSSFGDAPSNPDTAELTHTEAEMLLRFTPAKLFRDSSSDVRARADEIERQEIDLTVAELNEEVELEFWNDMTLGPGSVRNLNTTQRGGGWSLTDRRKRALVNALRRNDGPVAKDDIATKVLTIHASKGQEANQVVVYDGITNRVRESMRRRERSRRNEWRTWYVALTRAQHGLHIMRDAFAWTSPFIPQNILQMTEEATA